MKLILCVVMLFAIRPISSSLSDYRDRDLKLMSKWNPKQFGYSADLIFVLNKIEVAKKIEQMEQEKRNEIYRKRLVSRVRSSVLKDFFTNRSF